MGHIPIRRGQRSASGSARSSGCRPFEISNLGIAYVPQGREIFQAFTVEENLILGVLGKRVLPTEVPERLYAWFPILAERRWQRAGTHVRRRAAAAGDRPRPDRPAASSAARRAVRGHPAVDRAGARHDPRRDRRIGAPDRSSWSSRTSIWSPRIAARCLFIENGRLVDAAEPARLRADPSLLQRYLSV